jgi:hypothetical protein
MEMQNNQLPTSSENQKPHKPAPAVNESGSINVSGYIRIFDPSTAETLVEARE